MQIKMISTLLVLSAGLVFLACGSGNNNDAEVEAFVKERSDLVFKVAGVVEANPTDAGVTEAQKLLDSRTAELRSKQDALKSKIKGKGVTLFINEGIADRKVLTDICIKHAIKMTPTGQAECPKLYRTYQSAFDK